MMTALAKDVFELFSEIYDREKREDMDLQDFLYGCADDPMMYATAAERMIDAIGEPKVLETSQDPRLGRIFLNRTIKCYPGFQDFYGMEDTIQRIVGFFQYAAQGLEERKQILYLLGPVGGGKSSLAERLKQLIEDRPIYVLKAKNEISPVFESPLGLFDPQRMGDLLEGKYGITQRRLTGLISPWATKRLDEFEGDLSKFSVVKLMPSKLRQIAVAKTEPGDENNQDISALVGKIDIRKLEHFSQDDPDAYSFSGGPQPHHPGTPGVRRDVQGSHQGSAPSVDGHPGRQLPGHPELWRLSLSRRGPCPLQRIRVGAVQEQQEQRSIPRPNLRGQGALLSAGHRGSQDLPQAPGRKRTG